MLLLEFLLFSSSRLDRKEAKIYNGQMSFLQITWFVALLTIDERRVEQKRNGCCCCFIHQVNEAEDQQEKNEETNEENRNKNCMGYSYHPGFTVR